MRLLLALFSLFMGLSATVSNAFGQAINVTVNGSSRASGSVSVHHTNDPTNGGTCNDCAAELGAPTNFEGSWSDLFVSILVER
jgi:hypothetical protein